MLACWRIALECSDQELKNCWRWFIWLTFLAVLVVYDLKNDVIRSISQINQYPANFLLKVVLKLGEVSVLHHRVRVDPVDKALHMEDDLSLLANRPLVNLHAEYFSYLQDHSKLVLRGYICCFFITEKFAQQHVYLQNFACSDLLRVFTILRQLKASGQIWQEPHHYIVYAGHLTPSRMV